MNGDISTLRARSERLAEKHNVTTAEDQRLEVNRAVLGEQMGRAPAAYIATEAPQCVAGNVPSGR